MSNNANQLTNEQALDILFQVTELDTLKLNAVERRGVNAALVTLKNLVEAAKSQDNKVVELTSAPETTTV